MVSLLKKFLGRTAPQSSSPLYEVSAHDYFSRKLREDDMQPLRNLIDALARGFESQGIEAAILAVGSSTYPDEHWEYIAEVNEQEGREVRPAHYMDIDLKIVSDSSRVPVLKSSVERTLESHVYRWRHSIGVNRRVVNTNQGKHIYLEFEYGTDVITTELGNRTDVDIIFRPEGAREALREERLHNNPFSLLYQASGITLS